MSSYRTSLKHFESLVEFALILNLRGKVVASDFVGNRATNGFPFHSASILRTGPNVPDVPLNGKWVSPFLSFG